MKKIFLFTGILFVFCHIQAQEVTRGQLMNLYYKAQKAEKSNNTQEALEIYKTILSVDVNLPTPYLKMADIYAANENDIESIASAVALYKEYLRLNPTDKDAKTINQRIAQLQQKTGNISLQQERVLVDNAITGGNLQSLLGSNIVKNTVSSTDTNINVLWQKANAALANQNYDSASNLLNQLINVVPPNHPLFAQANIMLANIYGNKGQITQMSDAIDALESYITLHERVLSELSFYDAVVKNATPFEDDLCGIWISDFSNDKNSLPYVIMEISNSGSKYNFQILPHCTMAKNFNMYKGKPFNYSVKSMNSFSGNYVLAKAVDYAINGDNDMVEPALRNRAKLYFGAEKFRQGDAKFAKAAIDVTGEFGIALKKINLNNKDQSPVNAALKDASITAGVALLSGLFAQLAVSKNTVISIDMDIKRVFAGCAEFAYKETTHKESSDGGYSSSSSGKTMMLYKLYPDYDIKFVSDGYELFGHKTFAKNEIVDSEAYKYVSATKDRKDFNQRAYKKLSEKVSGLYQTTFPNRQDGLLETLQDRLEYETQGLSYQTVSNANGTFKGWMDANNRLNGWGYCILKSGYEYVGEWKNNKQSGKGKLTMPEVGVYSGIFVNGKFHNGGILTFDTGDKYEGNFSKGKRNGEGKYTYINGDMFEGIWKNDKPLKGTMKYSNGDRYEGQWSYNEKENRMERNGNGTMTYVNGEIVSGEWKNNEHVKK